MSDTPDILIAGLGNLLLMDDGVGVHAVRELLRDPPAGALVVEVGVAALDALHLLEGARRVLAIDAMRAGGSPGSLYLCDLDQIERPGHQASLHGLGLVAVLQFLPAEARPQVTVLGIEPERIDYGLTLSPAVAAALPPVVRTARELVQNWASSDPWPVASTQ